MQFDVETVRFDSLCKFLFRKNSLFSLFIRPFIYFPFVSRDVIVRRTKLKDVIKLWRIIRKTK